jgi:hypothetical protein
VLVDYYGWAQKNGIEYDPAHTHPISLEHVKAILQEKSVEVQAGDILFLRTGE